MINLEKKNSLVAKHIWIINLKSQKSQDYSIWGQIDNLETSSFMCTSMVESHGSHFQMQEYVCILFHKMQDSTFVVVECIFIKQINHHRNMLKHYLLLFPHI
jgi:hypothetical protein